MGTVVIQPRDNGLEIHLAGHWVQGDAQHLHRLLHQHLNQQHEAVLINLSQLLSCDDGARHGLAVTHQTLHDAVDRVVYLSNTPKWRSLATWVLHHAKDRSTPVVMNRQQAEVNLSQPIPRLDGAHERLQQWVGREQTS